MPYPQMNDPRNGQPRMPVDDGMSRPVPPVGYDSGAYPPQEYAPPYPPQGYDYPPQGQPGWQEGAYPGWQQPMQPTGPQQPPLWQTGPVPPPPDPFGETGVDISLRDKRSENVYERKDPFWDAPDQVHRKRRGDKPGPKKPKAHAGNHAAQRILLSVAILAAICLVVYGAVFRVRTIHVEGNVNIPDEQIIALSGIALGDSTLSIDEAATRQGVNGDHYLIFVSVDKQMPATVTLTVKERTPAAVMNYCGINYILDNKGMVLEESADIHAMAGLPEVSGMDLVGAYGATVGRKLNVNSTIQLDVMSEILIELRVLSAEGEVTKVIMSNLSQLLLETREGHSVNLGGYDRMHEKLKAMLHVKEYLSGMDADQGTIDVSDPEKPTFIPE